MDDFDVLDAAPPMVLEKLDRILPAVAQVQAVGGQWDISPALKGAVRQVTRFRASGAETIEAYFGQGSLLPDPEKADPGVQRLAFALAKMKPTAFQDAWTRYAALAKAAASDQVPLPGAEPKSQPEAFRQSFQGQHRAPELVEAPTASAFLDTEPTAKTQTVRFPSGNRAEATRVDGEWVVKNGAVYSVVRPEVLAGENTGFHNVVLGSDGATPTEAVRKHRDYQTLSAEVEAEKNSPENVFNRNPEQAVLRLDDDNLKTLAKTLGIKWPGGNLIRLVERVMDRPLEEVLQAYLRIADQAQQQHAAAGQKYQDVIADGLEHLDTGNRRPAGPAGTGDGPAGVPTYARASLLPGDRNPVSGGEAGGPDPHKAVLYSQAQRTQKVDDLQKQIERFEHVNFFRTFARIPGF